MIGSADSNLQLAVPIDELYLSRQVDDLYPNPLTHYLEHGLIDRLNPTPWFFTDWYAWQNPDWLKRHAAPYLHYLDVGRHEGRDPSPFVDVHRYRQFLGSDIPVGAVYDLILSGYRSPALGVVDENWVRSQQTRFLDSIQCLAHRVRPPTAPKPALVVLQAGRGSLARDWYHDAGRDWDILVNYYDAAGFVPGLGDYAFFQKGTKFTAMRYLLNRHAELFQAYSHVLFLDDDVETSVEDLNRQFAMCRKHDLDLAQMALTADSSSNWTELFARPGQTTPRPVSAVEIMMPVFSKAALALIKSTLGRSISGFGLDLVWGKIVGDAGGRIAVLDSVRAAHRRPVDQEGGAYYAYLRKSGINAKAELWLLLQEFGAERNLITASAA